MSSITGAESIAQDTVDIYIVPTIDNSSDINPLPPPVTATSITPQVSMIRRVSTRDISYQTSRVTQECYCPNDHLLFLGILIVVFPFVIFILERERAYLDQNNYSLKFEINSLMVSAFNISDSRLTANWNVKISTINQNSHKSFMYQSFEVAIYHHRDYLSEEGLGGTPFHQPPKNQTLLNARVRAYKLEISDSIAASMGHERDLGEIDFHVYIQTRIRYELASDISIHLITAACKYVKVGFAPNATKGTMIGHANICPVISNKDLDNQARTERAYWWKGVEDTIYTIDSS